MPVRSDVDSSTTGSGTTVEGTVVEEGPGGLTGFVCDVMMMLDGDKLQWVGPSSPSTGIYVEDKTDIYVWWKDIAIPKEPGVSFAVPVKWKTGAKGHALVVLVAFDKTEKVVTHDVVLLKKKKPGGKGKAPKASKKKPPKSMKSLRKLKKLEKKKPKPKKKKSA